MVEANEVVKAIELQIQKLDLKPGDKLAIIAPEDWNPRQIYMYSAYLDQWLKDNKKDIEILVFPYGVELCIVHPTGGFEE